MLAGGDVADAPLWLRVGAMGAGAIPVAVLVLLRRQRMRLQAADHPTEVAEVFGDGDAPHPGAIGAQPTPPPSLRRAIVLGLKWVCLALLIATPLALGWTFLIKVVTGETPSLQGLVQDALDPDATYEPWLIAAYGVIIAPLTEEALFRGLLYPGQNLTVGRVLDLQVLAAPGEPLAAGAHALELGLKSQGLENPNPSTS